MKKKTILLTAVAVMVAASASIAGMLAYFTDTEEVTNTFTAGKVDIAVTETAEADEGNNINGGVKTQNGFDYKLFPGQSYAKVPVISVEDGSEDAYLVAVVTIKSMADLKEAFEVDENDPLYLASEDGLVGGGLADPAVYPVGWVSDWYGMDGTMLKDADGKEVAFVTYAEDTANDSIVYTYWFVNVATAGDSYTLFEQLNIPSDFDNAEMDLLAGMTIDVVGYGIQAVGFDSVVDAFTAAEF